MPISLFGKDIYLEYITSLDMYLALCTTLPNDFDAGDDLLEAVGASYAREWINPALWGYDVNSNRVWNGTIELLPAEDWGLINSYALCDSTTAGEIYAFNTLTNIDVLSGSILRLPAGALVMGVE